MACPTPKSYNVKAPFCPQSVCSNQTPWQHCPYSIMLEELKSPEPGRRMVQVKPFWSCNYSHWTFEFKNPLQFSIPNLGYFYAYMAHFYNQSFYATLGILQVLKRLRRNTKKPRWWFILISVLQWQLQLQQNSVNEAWDILSDPAKRCSHDRHLMCVGGYLRHSTFISAPPKRTNNTY